MKTWSDIESSFLNWLKHRHNWSKNVSLHFVLSAKHFWIFLVKKNKNPMQPSHIDVTLWLSHLASTGVDEKKLSNLRKMIDIFLTFLSHNKSVANV